MHVTRPSRLVSVLPARRPSGRRGAIAVILFTGILLGGTLWFSGHGVSFMPCGEDPAAICQ